jgi:hypothetical protein
MIHATEMMGLQPGGAGGLLSGQPGQAGPQSPGAPGLPPEAMHCDPAPDITTATVCDKTYPAQAHFEWSACRLPPPGHHGGPPPAGGPGAPGASGPSGGAGSGQASGAGAQGPGQGQAPTSSGTIDLATSITTEPADSCGDDVVFHFQHQATYAIDRSGPHGGTLSLSGTSSATSAHTRDATTFTRTDTLDSRHTAKDASGAVQHDMHLQGTMTTAFDRSGAVPTRTMDGQLTIDFGDGTQGQVQVTGLVRVPPPECRFPIAGTIERTEPNGTVHTLVFGPSCGSATLDGSAIDLKALQGPHGRGGHPGGGHPHP